MCGRVTLTVPDVEEVAEALEATVEPEGSRLYRPRWNAAPTDVHFVARVANDTRLLVPAVWGLGDKSSLLINARAETITGKRTFRDAFERRRCIVPADGFYEWKGPKNDRRPVWFHRRGGGLLFMAGIFEFDGQGRPHFVILTTEANGVVAGLHDRMPLLLAREQLGGWLASPREDLLVPPPPELLVGTDASVRVNSVKNDDPSCLDPSGDKKREPPRQMTLL